MPLLEQRGALSLSGRDRLRRASGDHQGADRVALGTVDAADQRGPGHQDDVVLVLPPAALPLGSEDADHLAGDVLDADLPTQGRLVAEELADPRLSQDADPARRRALP